MNTIPAELPRPATTGSAKTVRSGDDARQAPVPSDQLLRGRRIVEITHNGEIYRLQSTRLGKLILTK